MSICMDLHTHTLVCGHGYSTLQENIEAAQRMGLRYLGLSEHAPAMPGSTPPFFFGNYKCIPRQYGDLTLLCGAEANILDYEGKLDLDDAILSRLEYVIASMHIPCVQPGTMEENTNACIKAMQNPYVKILGHPDDSRYPLDYEKVVSAAADEGVLLELNNSSLNPNSVRQGARENAKRMLELCREKEVSVLLGSDSHISYTIGRFDLALELLEEVQFPEELVLNYHPERIGQILNNPQ